jgi:hypothetical protein
MSYYEERCRLLAGIALGYKCISRRYGIVARIDRDDWLEHMARQHAPWSLADGMKWVRALGRAAAADHYRRVYSKDTLTLGELGAAFPGSRR